jgi:hypothetical protein
MITVNPACGRPLPVRGRRFVRSNPTTACASRRPGRHATPSSVKGCFRSAIRIALPDQAFAKHVDPARFADDLLTFTSRFRHGQLAAETKLITDLLATRPTAAASSPPPSARARWSSGVVRSTPTGSSTVFWSGRSCLGSRWSGIAAITGSASNPSTSRCVRRPTTSEMTGSTGPAGPIPGSSEGHAEQASSGSPGGAPPSPDRGISRGISGATSSERIQRGLKKLGLAVHAVSSDQVSARNSLLTGKIQGKFANLGRIRRTWALWRLLY